MLKDFGFSVLVFRAVCNFLRFSLWFSVFVNNDGNFPDFSAQYVLRFFWFYQGSYIHTRAITVVPRDHRLQLEECMTSLVSLAVVVWVVTTANQTMKN